MNHQENFTIEPYSPSDAHRWDSFVDSSRNATFLLKRSYMDYHSDRFTDASLLVFKSGAAQRQAPVALFAASSTNDDTVSAHGGLSYGGLVLPYSGIDGSDVVTILQLITGYFRQRGFKRMVYKAIPYIYHRYPSDDDIYAIFRAGGNIIETNLSSSILLSTPVPFNNNGRRNLKRAQSAGIVVSHSHDYAAYWDVLSQVLYDRHKVAPVHTPDEICLLAERFPANIKLYTAHSSSGTLVAGTLLYITDTCVHTQYIAASPDGRNNGALALIFDKIIQDYAATHRYLDFGISNEDHGRYLNAGLIRQKYGFGGRGVAYNIYEIIFDATH